MSEAERHGLDEAVEARLAGAKSLLGGELVAAGGGFLELSFERRNQPREVLLGDVVVRAGAHGFDRRLFGDGARHHDEGNV